MKAGWKLVSLGDVIDLQSGFAFKSAEYTENGHFLVRIANVQDGYVSLDKPKFVQLDEKTERFELNEGDVLTSLTGNIGRVAEVTAAHMPAALNQRVARITLKQDTPVDRGFLLRFLSSSAFSTFLQDASHGAAQANVSPKAIKDVPFPLPPLEEQRRIVAILAEAFEGLARAKENAEANLQNAQKLFESALGDLFSREKTTSVRTVGSLVEEGILEKPMDGNHGEIHPKKADFVDSGIPFVMASDLKGGQVDQIECNHISREQADNLRKGFAKDGDVLLSHKGTIGRTAVLRTDYDYVMLTPQVTYYRTKCQDKLHPRYLYFAFRSGPFQRQIINAAGGGATRAYIGITKQLDLLVPVPSIEKQIELSAAAEMIEAGSDMALDAYKTQVSDVEELRRALLHKAFEGELT